MSHDLHDVLWPKGPRGDIWAIIDTARDQKLYWELHNSFLNWGCLFAGHLPEALEMAAPYLVQLDADDKFTEMLAGRTGDSVGIFLQCDTTMKALRHHLRKFLTVTDTTGRRMLFRYYDPRVLRVYLPTCDTKELQTVFGPIQNYWTDSEKDGALTQFQFNGRKLQVTECPLGLSVVTKKEAAGVDLPAAVLPAQKTLIVQKGGGTQVRVPVVLQAAGRGGKLTRSGPNLRVFRSLTAADELPFVNHSYSVPVSNLDPDLTVYVAGTAAGQETLTLDLGKGAPASETLTIAELTLETGAAEGTQFSEGIYVGVAGPGSAATRRRIVVHPPVPANLTGPMVLRTAPGGPALKIFTNAGNLNGAALASGFEFDVPAAPVNFWLEADKESAAAGDGALHLSIGGSAAAGDWCKVTALSLTAIAAGIPSTPPLTPRLPGAAPVPELEFAIGAEEPLVLLSGSVPADSPVRLRALAKVGGFPLQWSVTRLGSDLPALSELPLPALTVEDGRALLLTDSAGSFAVRATAGADGWGGPGIDLKLVLVQAALVENQTTINGRFCTCAREPGVPKFGLRSGKDAASVQLGATVSLSGGGADGKAGLQAIFGGWVNNLVSDNTGARFKGGGLARVTYRLNPEDVNSEIDLEPGPLLDTTGERCLAGSKPAGALNRGEVAIQAQCTPAAIFPLQDAAGRPIEQIWSYIECRSYLVLWSKHAPGLPGVLLETGWSFTGDYAVTPAKVSRPIVAARLSGTKTVPYAALVPAVKAKVELHAPSTGASQVRVDGGGRLLKE